MTTTSPIPSKSMAMTANATELVLLDFAQFPAYLSPELETLTWTYGASTWVVAVAASPANTGNPSARTDGALSYDGTSVVLFGGKGLPAIDNFLGDTWLFASGAWSLSAPTVSPSPRSGHCMASLTGSCLMFSGMNELTMLEETWLWSSAGTWTQQTVASGTGPSARVGAAMASNGTTTAFLFSGANTSFLMQDTWKWTSGNWTQVSNTVSPPARTGAAFAWNGTNYILFGGKNQANTLGDTWQMTTSGVWSRLTPSVSPPYLYGAVMAYDTTLGKLVLTGGADSAGNANSNTYAYNAGTNTWTQL